MPLESGRTGDYLIPIMLTASTLHDRAVLALEGADAASFLQGLITADIARVTEEHAVLAAFLSPQGKFLADFFILKQGERYLLETERATFDNLLRRLSMYKLRADVQILPQEGWEVVSLRGDKVWEQTGLKPTPGAVEYASADQVFLLTDPRSARMGVRLIGRADGIARYLTQHPVEASAPEEYEYHRLSLGIPEGSKDAVVDRTVALENGYDKLHAVDFTKGCYVGQEVTARSHHLGTLRKRLYQIRSEHPLPPPGSEIHAGERNLGQIRSTCRDVGLAIIRGEEWENARKEGVKASSGGVEIVISPPFWHQS